MPPRIALETLDGKKTPLDGCAFANGYSLDAPECSAPLVLSKCLDQLARESVRGVCDTGRYHMKYRVWGRGPALIIIPGLCDEAESFVMPLARLSRRFCCITYDLPTGSGDGASLTRYGHDDLVADLFALF